MGLTINFEPKAKFKKKNIFLENFTKKYRKISESGFRPRFTGSVHQQSSDQKHIKPNCQCQAYTK